jgi:acetyltransferase-like isoleucine patch superfamily enzyme
MKLKRKPQYYLYKIIQEFKKPFINYLCKLKFRYWGVELGNGVKFLGFSKILNMNIIQIGENTRIVSKLGNNVGRNNTTVFQTGQEGEIIIGKNVGISNCTMISQKSIQIDDQVYIGGGTRIYDNDFHPIDRKTRIQSPTEIPSAKIHIKEGVFIGGHCTILKGVIIGENSVIGANSLVTKNIPSNEIWGGVPAKKIKSL